MLKSFFPTGRRRWVHIALLVFFIAAALGHQASLWDWYIEDSAITFAYAKNFAEGHGLVSFVGGERVEGYSNPTWTLFLAGVHFVGLEIYDAVAWIQLLFSAATSVAVYGTMREVCEEESDLPLVAPALLAANAQFAIWGGAGLENGILNLFISLAIYRSFVELRTKSWPLSALLWLLVALSRPEAILYAAVAGFWQMVFTTRESRSPKSTFKWLATFFIPFGIYHVVHYWYFAYPFPNTYYAKLEHRYEEAKPPGFFDWKRAGWMYLRNWAASTGQGAFLVFYSLGVSSAKGFRLWATTGFTLFVLLMVQVTGNQRFLIEVLSALLLLFFCFGVYRGEKSSAIKLVSTAWAVVFAAVVAVEVGRWKFEIIPNSLPKLSFLPDNTLSFLIVFGFLLISSLGFKAKHWRLRQLCFSLTFAAMCFAVVALGDWMKGFRWLSTAAVPGAILVAFGIEDFVLALKRISHSSQRHYWAGRVLTSVIVLAMVPGFAFNTNAVATKTDASPKSILKRVQYVNGIRSRMLSTVRWTDLDVDQGAHLYWSDFRMLDIAGLIDLPMGHNKFNKAFINEYIYEEEKPQFAHLHDFWANKSKINQNRKWKKQYFEVPGYPAGSQLHVGNFIRRDLVMKPWPHDSTRETTFDGDFTLLGVNIPSEPSTSRMMFVEVGVSARQISRQDVRMLLFIGQDQVQQTFDIPLGYDWLPPSKWHRKEAFYGRYAIPLRGDIKPGTYTVGVVFLDEDGKVLQATEEQQGDPWFAPGEVRFKDALTVLSLQQRDAKVAEKRAQVDVLANKGECDEAREMYLSARWHVARDMTWLAANKKPVDKIIAQCWVTVANKAATRAEKIEALTKAHRLDSTSKGKLLAAAPLAADLHKEGVELMEQEDYEAAYRHFADALAIAPHQAWSRRYAEVCRRHRLKMDEPPKKMEPKAKGKKKTEAKP